MLDANNFVFLIVFENSSNAKYIVNTIDTKDLVSLANELKERKKNNTHSFKVSQLDHSKNKFIKISIQKFISCTDFCTELNVILNTIYSK